MTIKPKLPAPHDLHHINRCRSAQTACEGNDRTKKTQRTASHAVQKELAFRGDI